MAPFVVRFIGRAATLPEPTDSFPGLTRPNPGLRRSDSASALTSGALDLLEVNLSQPARTQVAGRSPCAFALCLVVALLAVGLYRRQPSLPVTRSLHASGQR